MYAEVSILWGGAQYFAQKTPESDTKNTKFVGGGGLSFWLVILGDFVIC